ncbi:DUF4249 domain-containing protein [Aquiflexum sp.]|uniref:DUF4249 domain-containing protein n=1 Tax=Aquiflexum sp. TaxID=1872584 RepID=UPI0035947920
MKNRILIFCILITSCIDPYTIEAPEGESMLSVEGNITDGPGPHIIKVSRTATYGSVFVDFIRPVVQANVAIREFETGLMIFLNEVRGGVYETPAGFSATTGNSYSLLITTREGLEYTSFPSKANKAPSLDSLTYHTITIPSKDRLNPRSGIKLVAHFSDPSDDRNNYFWNIKNAVSTVETYPEFYKSPRKLPTDPYEPKECCKYCDVPGFTVSRGLFLEDDTNFNGLRTSQTAGYIEDDGYRLAFRYRFDFEQMAISEETFRYLRLVNQQMILTGSVFDPPPANIRGNMISITNPDETVLGHFFAAGISSKKVSLRGSELNLLKFQQPFNDDCRELRNAVVSDDWFED